jgi:hypothetical protein
MAFSSDVTGYRLLEKEERFAENAGKKFPYGLDGWLSEVAPESGTHFCTT